MRDILFFESDRRKVRLVAAGGREETFYDKLDNVEERLKKEDFVRCHQSYFVNARKIDTIRGGELVMSDGSVLPVSKHRAKETNEAFLWAMR